jgi:3'-phosphoadenosine 5'-phosphosulfate (PAPS) 3'-phosphatase
MKLFVLKYPQKNKKTVTIINSKIKFKKKKRKKIMNIPDYQFEIVRVENLQSDFPKIELLAEI